MARGPRLDALGLVQHVMMRGIERSTLFFDEVDRREYRRRLNLLLPECGTRCLAWSLMPNHIHLLLQTTRASLSQTMARLNTSYAMYFNRRHDRVGHLFQNRFKSRPAEDEGDVMNLVRYVHRNPLEAGIVRSLGELEQFRWCGHGALTGTRGAWRFEGVSLALSYFDTCPERARRELRSWMGATSREAPSVDEGGSSPTTQV